MSSIHEIARTGADENLLQIRPVKEMKSSDIYEMRPDEAPNDAGADDADDLLKPQESIHQEFRQFEKSISQIDDKFNILNSNLKKY